MSDFQEGSPGFGDSVRENESPQRDGNESPGHSPIKKIVLDDYQVSIKINMNF